MIDGIPQSLHSPVDPHPVDLDLGGRPSDRVGMRVGSRSGRRRGVTANRLLLSTSGSSHRPALRATGPVEESALATHGRPLEGEEFA